MTYFDRASTITTKSEWPPVSAFRRRRAIMPTGKWWERNCTRPSANTSIMLFYRQMDMGCPPTVPSHCVGRWLDSYLLARSSLLEDNSFTFFEKHNLGRLHFLVPVGYQAVWGDRAKVVVAKLDGSVSSATAMAQLPNLLVKRAGSRPNDEFVEFPIFAKDGFDTKDVDMITIETKPATKDEMHRWEIIKSSAGARSPPIVVFE